MVPTEGTSPMRTSASNYCKNSFPIIFHQFARFQLQRNQSLGSFDTRAPILKPIPMPMPMPIPMQCPGLSRRQRFRSKHFLNPYETEIFETDAFFAQTLKGDEIRFFHLLSCAIAHYLHNTFVFNVSLYHNILLSLSTCIVEPPAQVF